MGTEYLGHERRRWGGCVDGEVRRTVWGEEGRGGLVGQVHDIRIMLIVISLICLPIGATDFVALLVKVGLLH